LKGISLSTPAEPNNRLIWGIVPDFWSISGSGLILGGAIWVAVAKSRLRPENSDDRERNEYIAIRGENHCGKSDGSELEELLSDDEDSDLHVTTSASGSTCSTPSREAQTPEREARN
jgi:hypothetical protein